jgi:enoyl-CoA hydratase/carnithine racemase
MTLLDLSRYHGLKLDVDDGVMTVTIDNPAERNAMTPEMFDEMHHIWRDITDDETIHVVILTATGNRAFSAGGNVKDMAERRSGNGVNWRGSFLKSKRLLEDMLAVEQPIICALNGDAYGLGATLALMCDIIVANERARLADSHVKVGLVAGDGGALAWPLMMSIHKAKEHLLRGNPLLAADAARLGIINYAVPYEEVMPKAREIARELADGAPWAIRWTKTAVNKIAREHLNLLIDTSLATEWLTFMSDDHAEAARAFVEKRTPQFIGR